MALTVVVHSFVADTETVVIWWWCFLGRGEVGGGGGGAFFSPPMLAGRPSFGFLGWFQCFCFSFGVSCLHAWYGQPLIFRLPPAFVVWSFLAIDTCVQSLSFTAFSAVGLCVVFALLALVSGYPCTSQFLVSCCALAARQLALEIETGHFSKSITLWTPLQILLWSKPHLVFHKVYEIALSEVLAT